MYSLDTIVWVDTENWRTIGFAKLANRMFFGLIALLYAMVTPVMKFFAL